MQLTVNTGDIEVKIISKYSFTEEELKKHKEEGLTIVKGYWSERYAYLTLRSGEKKTINMDQYSRLHPEEEKSKGGWVGFDVEIRPIGREASFDYQVNFK